LSDYDYELIYENSPFTLKINRKVNSETIFQIRNLQFSNYYISFESIIATPNFFGLGERNSKGFRFKTGIYTLNARDEPKLIEDGRRPGKNVYSS